MKTNPADPVRRILSPNRRIPKFLRTALVLASSAILSTASAATLVLTPTPPDPGPDDVYNLDAGANDDANVNNGNDGNTYVAGDRPTQGQFFTTGPNASGYVLTDIWIRHCGYTLPASSGNGTWWNMGNGGVWVVRVTDPSKNGQAGFVLRSETYVSTGTENSGAAWNGAGTTFPLGDDMWLRFTLGTPLQVQPNTQYGIDLTATGSPGLNYFEWLGNRTNVLATGAAYTGTTAATPGNTVNATVGDRVFLVQLGNFIPAVQPELTSPLRFVPVGETSQVVVTIPPIANSQNPATLVLTNNDPDRISLPGGAGTLTLNFAVGATNVQTFNVQVLANGIGTLSVITNNSFTEAFLQIGTPLLALESFEYDMNSQVYVEGADGGSGFDGPWSQPTFADVIVPGLAFDSGATSFTTSSNAAGIFGNGNEAFRQFPGTYGGVGGGTLYVGFLVQAPNGALFDWGGLSLWNGTVSENLFMGTVIGLSPNDTWGFLQGGNTQMGFAGSSTPGLDTDLLIYRIDFPTTNGGMARVSFYANPPMNSNEPFTPTGSAFVNNFTFDRVRLGTAESLYFDEIRIGTHWTNVMEFSGPAQPLPPPTPALATPSRFAPIGGSTIVTVTLPPAAPLPLSMTLSNDNPAAFSISGTNAALTTLTFHAGSTNVQGLTVQCLGEGVAALTVLSNASINTASIALAAQVSAGDSFAYDEMPGGLPGQVGGAGWEFNPWTGIGDIAAPGLAYPGLVTEGNAASIVAGSAERILSTLSGTHGGTGGGTVWISFLVQGAFPETPGSAGVSFLNGAAVPLFLGLDTGAPNNGKWGFTGAAQGQDADFPNSVTPSTNTTLLVYRVDFPTSGELAQVTFYANPPAAPAPPGIPSGSGAVRNFNFTAIRLGTSFNMAFDEVRLGATWESVVPVSATAVLNIRMISPSQVRIAWPAALTGYTLESSSNATGPWAEAGLAESTEGEERTATDTLTGNAKFYRLAQ